MKVLVIDDEITLREFLKEVITSQGHSCVTACNGQDAWNALQYEQGIDFIFTDCMMPVMSGPELLQKIIADDNLKNIPVVCMSGTNSWPADLVNQAKGLLRKPFDVDKVLSFLS